MIAVLIICFWIVCSVTAYNNILQGWGETRHEGDTGLNTERRFFSAFIAIFGPLFWLGVFLTKYITIPLINFITNLEIGPLVPNNVQFINNLQESIEQIRILSTTVFPNEDAAKKFKILVNKLINEIEKGIELFPDEEILPIVLREMKNIEKRKIDIDNKNKILMKSS